jgi:hypothetical protein
MRLSRRQLNRATMARQLLLERADIDVVSAVARLGGLQAQEPASPYLALWTRLRRLDAADVSTVIGDRRLIKATLHRSTLHLVAATDYRALLPALTAVTRTKWMNETRGLPVRRTLPELAEEVLTYAQRPRTNVELRDRAATLGEPVPADELWRRIRRYAAFVHVPTDAAWSYGRRPVQVAARAWLEEPRIDEEGSLEHVVRRHLTAFGPARPADIAQWSGLAVGRLRVGLERIADLVRHEDEEGRELFDLPGAPLPDPDTPAPPRLLPMWDETLLAYADRSRVLPEAYHRRVIVTGGDVLPTFTIDGRVAGLWWAETDEGGGSRIVLEPFAPIEERDHEVLRQEAYDLARFIAPREPDVYRRYRFTRRKA